MADPTDGFTPVPLHQSNFEVQKPYDVPQNQRYSHINGVHKLWVYSTDKAHTTSSHTAPRTEIRFRGYDYSSGVWQFEGYGYVPSGTTGVSIMQVFGATNRATTLMVRVYDVLESDIYNRWFRLNVIHDADAGIVKIYIDGDLKYEGPDNGGKSHYFKFGVYEQNNSSNYMESRWKEIKVFKK
ncbi:hypothetical protein PVL29_027098 [Vitis rotundifolia]|uniref:Alginate lyase 2 domain-containing protein n=1 Tax=Vitis rotundifolia TaxID=103349 RepID=A0AA38YIB1_VITRO|nr:hypothetical protein PVL29_027098 [Vitis rotundifolia]